MRQRIDITDMEVRTKIRAKYLRALENEEWDLLPGPTYVKSFLRTYADALGLDSRALVEEYKLRHEPLETGELHPIRRPTAREQRRRAGSGGGGRGGLPGFAIVGLVLAAIVVALFIIGQGADDGGDDAAQITTTPARTSAKKKPAKRKKPAPPPKPTTVRVQIVPTAAISVCLVNASGDVLIGNQILQPGQPSETYKSKKFRLVLGNNALQLKINGTTREVPPSSGPIAYTITPNGRSELPVERRPTCQPA